MDTSPRTRDAVRSFKFGVVDATADHSAAVAVSLEIAAMMGACDCGHDLGELGHGRGLHGQSFSWGLSNSGTPLLRSA